MRPPHPALTVRRADFQRAIRIVTKGLRAKRPFEIRIDYTDEGVSMHGLGASMTFDGKGYWPGSAFVPGNLLKRLASHLPSADPLLLEVKDERLVIDTVHLSCRWQDIAPPALMIPLDASVRDILAVGLTKPEAVVTSSGLHLTVEAAKQQLEQRISEVTKLLAPLGITAADVWGLVKRKLAEVTPVKETTRWESDQWFFSDPSASREAYVALALSELDERRRQGNLSDEELRDRLNFLSQF